MTRIIAVTILLVATAFGYRLLNWWQPGVWAQLPPVTSNDIIHAAQQGDHQAQFALGTAYQQRALARRYPDRVWWERDLASRDLLEAVRWFRQAAQSGNLPAMNQIAIHYLEGWGIAQDLNQAAIFLQHAIDRNYTPAQVSLARVQLERATIKSHQRYHNAYYQSAFQLLDEAARQGNPEGQFWLGNLYAQGIRQDDNGRQAEYWWSLAAAQGFEPASRALSGLPGE